MKLSIVIPVYNSQNTIVSLVDTLQRTFTAFSFEIILINDGSSDNSEAVCTGLAKQFTNVHFISLRKNFGEFNAVMCGLNQAQGTFCVLIDDDFQNPPEEILKLIAKAEEGNYDVVYSFYPEKKHAWYRNAGSNMVNWVTSYLLHKPHDLYLSSFKLLRKEVVSEVVKYKGPYPYIDGLIFRVTKNVGKVSVEHRRRQEGASNYTLSKLISLFLNILFCYSSLPIRIFLPLGLGLLGVGTFLFMYLLGLLICKAVVAGWLVVVASVFLVGGIQCTLLSVVGEYIGKSFMTQNGQPQYVIKYDSAFDL